MAMKLWIKRKIDMITFCIIVRSKGRQSLTFDYWLPFKRNPIPFTRPTRIDRGNEKYLKKKNLH